MSDPLQENVPTDFEAVVLDKLDKLIGAVNSLGALAEKHDADLTAIVQTVNDFRQTVGNMNPREMLKGLMSRG